MDRVKTIMQAQGQIQAQAQEQEQEQEQEHEKEQEKEKEKVKEKEQEQEQEQQQEQILTSVQVFNLTPYLLAAFHKFIYGMRVLTVICYTCCMPIAQFLQWINYCLDGMYLMLN